MVGTLWGTGVPFRALVRGRARDFAYPRPLLLPPLPPPHLHRRPRGHPIYIHKSINMRALIRCRLRSHLQDQSPPSGDPGHHRVGHHPHTPPRLRKTFLSNLPYLILKPLEGAASSTASSVRSWPVR